MSGLTAEQHKKLLESIKQWGDSQDRIQAEQDHQAALAAALLVLTVQPRPKLIGRCADER